MFALFLLLLSGCADQNIDIISAGYSVIPADERLTVVRENLINNIEETGVASVSVSVAENGIIIWQEAFGYADIENSVPATPKTMYSVASITKPMVAAGIMKLAELGNIDIDMPADSYLGDSRLTAYEGRLSDATVRTVMTHTSGLPFHYHFFFEDEDYVVPGMEETIRKYGIITTEPGEVFNYSNFGYGLLDHIISEKSGEPFGDFLVKNLFKPLNMQRTAIIVNSSELSDAVKRYSADREEIPFYDHDHRGASSAYSTPHDLVRFGMLFINDLQSDQERPLTQETVSEVLRGDGIVSDSRKYSLGWFTVENDYGYETAYHTGGMHGVRAILKFIPSESIAVSVICNTRNNISLSTADDIIGGLLPDFAQKRNAEPESVSDEEAVVIPDEYTGNWSGEIRTYQGTMPVTMTIEYNGDIKVRLADQPEQTVSGVRMDQNMLRGRFDGTIETGDTAKRDHRIDLRLKFRGDRLSGAATAVSNTGRGFALTSWIRLSR